jgi:hypothetical protein
MEHAWIALLRAVNIGTQNRVPMAGLRRLVEDAAAGQRAIQEPRRTTPLPVLPVRPRGSKTSRVEAISPLLEVGRVLFPDVEPSWLVATLARVTDRLARSREGGPRAALFRLRDCGAIAPRERMPKVGIEPTRPEGHRILSPARLPVPPLRPLSS